MRQKSDELESFAIATKRYERWLRSLVPLDERALREKRRLMAESPFAWLRATFYRWAKLWPRECPELATAPTVLAVGDLHVDNFGTWHDREDRLVWGVNDFDEAFPMPYTQDLVRLATSARLTPDLPVALEPACTALLRGYRASLRAGGCPFVLAEKNERLRALTRVRKKDDPEAFWQRAQVELRKISTPPLHIRLLAARSLPKGVDLRFRTRYGGLGSLGRPRVVATGTTAGSKVARELKQLVPSGWAWAHGGATQFWVKPLLASAIRSPDPLLQLEGSWLIRRFGPGTARIDLEMLDEEMRRKAALHLLESMGWETANVHLGTKSAAHRILADLEERRGRWLAKAARRMSEIVTDEFAANRPRKKR